MRAALRRAAGEAVLFALLLLDGITAAAADKRPPPYVRPAAIPRHRVGPLALGCLLGAFLWAAIILAVLALIRWARG